MQARTWTLARLLADDRNALNAIDNHCCTDHDDANDFCRSTRAVERLDSSPPDPHSSNTLLKESEAASSEVVSILCCPKASRRLVPCVLPSASTQEQVPCRRALRVACLSGRAAG